MPSGSGKNSSSVLTSANGRTERSIPTSRRPRNHDTSTEAIPPSTMAAAVVSICTGSGVRPKMERVLPL